MVWIGAHKDLGDYDDLIGHATGIGVNALWLYQELDNTDIYSNNNIKSFAMFAWKWSWLRKFERRWVYTYRCMNQDPCDCDPNRLAGGWILQSKYSTTEIREVYY